MEQLSAILNIDATIDPLTSVKAAEVFWTVFAGSVAALVAGLALQPRRTSRPHR